MRFSKTIPRLAGPAVLALLIAAVAGIALIRADNANAATFTVSVGNNWFGNSSYQNGVYELTISAGDTVTWQRSAGTHDVTECASDFSKWDEGLGECVGTSWSGPIAAATPTYSRTFNTPGTYGYLCTLHADEMRGRIIVQAAEPDTTPPVVTNVGVSPNPTNGAAGITITATVTDQGTPLGTIASAQYRIDGGTPAGMAAADGSFNSSTENVTANASIGALADGPHTVEVRGVDNSGNASAWVAASFDKTPPPAGAVQATVTVEGGALTNTAQDIAFGSVSLAGADQTVTSAPATWQARDARGSGDGWNVTVSSTDFSGPGMISVSNFKMRQQESQVVTVAGNTAPNSLVTSFQSLSAAPLKVLQAGAGAGMGTYDYTPDFQLTVPASASAGSYSANVTVSINSGP